MIFNVRHPGVVEDEIDLLKDARSDLYSIQIQRGERQRFLQALDNLNWLIDNRTRELSQSFPLPQAKDEPKEPEKKPAARKRPTGSGGTGGGGRGGNKSGTDGGQNIE